MLAGISGVYWNCSEDGKRVLFVVLDAEGFVGGGTYGGGRMERNRSTNDDGLEGMMDAIACFIVLNDRFSHTATHSPISIHSLHHHHPPQSSPH